MSDIDGLVVTWARNETWKGRVISDSYLPGFVRVKWNEPKKFLDMMRPEELVVVDDQTPSP